MGKMFILPDIHGRTFWKKPLEKCIDSADKVIFLGDYLDSYPDEWDKNHKRQDDIDNFLEIIDLKAKYEDKVILLKGNHDEHYINPTFNRICGGCRKDRLNGNMISEIFDEFKEYFKLAHEETVGGKKLLFTHAGVMGSWYERHKDVIGELTAGNLNKLENTNDGELALCDVSFERGGPDPSGSILWSDVRERFNDSWTEILSSEEITEYDFQIFGHTRLRGRPLITSKWACIDCSKVFVVGDDGKPMEYNENG